MWIFDGGADTSRDRGDHLSGRNCILGVRLVDAGTSTSDHRVYWGCAAGAAVGSGAWGGDGGGDGAGAEDPRDAVLGVDDAVLEEDDVEVPETTGLVVDGVEGRRGMDDRLRLSWLRLHRMRR